MDIINIPSIIDEAVYHTALSEYTRLCSRFTHSIYSAGNVRYPGISDLDIIVIPRSMRVDSARLQFTGKMHGRFGQIIHHEPFVVPLDVIDIWRYAEISNVKVVFGDSLLPSKDATPREYILANALEAMLCYIQHIESIHTTGVIDARTSIAVFSSLRFTIKSLVELGVVSEIKYANEVDRLRKRISIGEGPPCVIEMYQFFSDTMSVLNREIARSFDIKKITKENIRDFYGHGSQLCGFHADILNQRMIDIESYRILLQTMGYPFGSLFRSAFHGSLPIALHHKLRRRVYFLFKKIF